MPDNDVPPNVVRFLGDHIDSAEKLEILLYLYRHSERGWTAEELSPAVYTVPAAAMIRMEELLGAGFLTTTGGGNPTYRFEPREDGLRTEVSALDEAYRQNRVSVIRAVHTAPKAPHQSFSDAFRLRGNR